MSEPMECSKCHREGLTTDDFSKDKRWKRGYGSWCKKCCSEHNRKRYVENSELFKERSRKWGKENRERKTENNRKWRADNPEKGKESTRRFYMSKPEQYMEIQRKSKYGVNSEEQRKLFNKQGGKCLICSVELDYRKAHLDHDHATDKVRGFLCRGCNISIGLLKEDPKRMRRAAAYIHMHQLDHPNPHQVMLNIRDRNFKES